MINSKGVKWVLTNRGQQLLVVVLPSLMTSVSVYSVGPVASSMVEPRMKATLERRRAPG